MFGQRMMASMARSEAPPAAQPKGAPDAPPGGAPSPAGTAPLATGGDGRLPQRTSLKVAAVEEMKPTFLVRHEKLKLQREERRAASLDSLREGNEADAAVGQVD